CPGRSVSTTVSSTARASSLSTAASFACVTRDANGLTTRTPVGTRSATRVAAHAVEQKRGETVGERVGVGVRAQPGIGPVRRREREQRGRSVIEIGAQLTELASLPKQRAEALFVPAALGDELLAVLAFEIAPLPHEHRGD